MEIHKQSRYELFFIFINSQAFNLVRFPSHHQGYADTYIQCYVVTTYIRRGLFKL